MVRTIREAEWDDESRAEMLALEEFERGVCDQCGFHKSLCGDPANHFTFEFHVCTVAAARARWERKVSADDEKARPGKDQPPESAHPDDGRQLLVRPMSDEEVANVARRAPVAPAGSTG